MHRRRFATLLGGAVLAPLWGCQRLEPDRQAIVRILGLSASELAWLERLAPDALRELRDGLERPGGERTARAVDLTFHVIADRSRTFAFVGYPALPDRRSVCDGLLAE
jgi:hypothetical protein